MAKAVGLLELAGIAPGYVVANEVGKQTSVDFWVADTLCPGRFLLVIFGDTASVQMAMEMAVNLAKDEILSEGILANIDAEVFRALQSPGKVAAHQALGIVETLAIAPAILAADGALKTAQVELVELRITGGMGGKALVCFAGEVNAVQVALAHIRNLVDPVALASSVLLASPHPELVAFWEQV